MITSIIWSLATIIWSLISARQISASSDFDTSFTSRYEISALGHAKVTHTIGLKNNLSHIYATEYSLATSGDQLQHVLATDETGTLNTTTTTQNGATTIHIDISRPAVGLAQVKTLTLSYETDDVVEKIGDTTTINIPRLAKANESSRYTRIVEVQGIEDTPSYIYPVPSTTEVTGSSTIYTFEGHLGDSLSLLFGNSATYKLDLTYELRNKELSEVDSELALPPDTGYQHIVISKLDPSPLGIQVDSDGNWLARYHLKGQEKLVVQATLYVTVYPVPTLIDPSTTVLENTARPKYWDTNAQIVSSLSQQLKTVDNIYTYLSSNFSYNYTSMQDGGVRLGASRALGSPTSVLCTEFTDAFVALSRAASTPSREINGYGYTRETLLKPQNLTTDVLHAWPEYYDKESKHWVAVDPTWGNTTGGIDYFHKLDFSHITFVRHGVEETYPLPAGAYKSESGQKYVNVTVATEIPKENVSSLKKDGRLYNTGNTAINDPTLGYIPPYGSVQLSRAPSLSLYDKIKLLCAKLLSVFSRQP